jgi:hypothetical protein
VVDNADEAVRTPGGAMKVEDANKQGMAHQVNPGVVHPKPTGAHLQATEESTSPEKVR